MRGKSMNQKFVVLWVRICRNPHSGRWFYGTTAESRDELRDREDIWTGWRTKIVRVCIPVPRKKEKRP